jgi:hypothetical protein
LIYRSAVAVNFVPRCCHSLLQLGQHLATKDVNKFALIDPDLVQQKFFEAKFDELAQPAFSGHGNPAMSSFNR